MPTIHPITIAEFVQLLMGKVKHPFAGLVACTVPTLTVKDRNDHARTWAVAFPGIDKANVRKIMHGAIYAGPDYEKMVLRELEKEHKDPIAWKRGNSWHEAVPGAKCLRQHKSTGELYFWCAFVQKRVKKDADGNPVLNAEGRPVYVPIKPKVKYVDISTGNVIPTADLHGFTKVDKAPSNQGTDKGREVIVRCYMLQSVRTLVVDGVCYTIIGKTL
jgi:hypothetical protein